MKPINKDDLVRILDQNYSFNSSLGLTLLREGPDNDVYIFFSRNGQKVFARVGKRENSSAIDFEADLIKALVKKRIKIAPIIKTLSGEKFLKLSNKTAIVCLEFIDGQAIDLKDGPPSLDLVKQAASNLADFHKVTLNLSLKSKKERTIYSELERAIELESEIKKLFKKGDVFIRDIKRSLKEAKKRRALWGIIHNDYNPSNVLFKNKKLVAIVDFDWSCPGPLLMDVGYGASTWSTKNKEIAPDYKVFDKFVDSYRKASSFFIADKELFFWTAYSCLYLAACFICDSAVNNEHNITEVDQCWMYQRFKFYSDKFRNVITHPV